MPSLYNTIFFLNLFYCIYKFNQNELTLFLTDGNVAPNV
jgi:hypothetical protein